MEVSPTEVVTDLTTVNLDSKVTNGLVPDQVIGLKERVVEVNEELVCVGQSIRSIAANLSEIKKNVKGKWGDFIESGAVNLTPKACKDLVSAHDRWLGSSDVADHILSPLSYRSRAVLGGTDTKPVTDMQRQKVFELVESGEKVTEATVRRFVTGRTKQAKSAVKKTESEKITALNKKIDTYKKTISHLMDENKKLRAMAEQANKQREAVLASV